ncbi:MAG: ankyrin repeat domain-containing protein [Burkholderiaceae bacterium]|jgi:ankyrin repeat protein|nr:ankyrin repeat domain-containing protein [Burkholderiaceae bacterium]
MVSWMRPLTHLPDFKQGEMSMHLSRTLVVQAICVIWLLLCPAVAPAGERAASPDASSALTLPGYWEVARPEQVRRLVAGRSLAGVRDAANADGLTPLMLAAWHTPYPEMIDILIKAGCAVNAQGSKRVYFRRPGAPKGAEAESEDLRSALHFALANPNPAILAALLRHKPNLDDSVLKLAVKRPDRVEHLRLLLKAGVRPGRKTGAPLPKDSIWRLFLGYNCGLAGRDDPLTGLHYARGLLVLAPEAAAKTRLLLAYGVRPDLDALGRALAAGHNEAARLLLDAGVNPAGTINGKSMLYHALYRVTAKQIAQYDYFIAAPAPDPVLLRRLIRAAGSLAGQGDLLVRASTSGLSADIARMLVKAGAPYSTKGNALMFEALKSDNDCADLVEYLLELGFSAQDRGDGGLSPLRASAEYPKQKPRCAQVLVKAGVTEEDIRDILGMYADFARKAGISDASGRAVIEAVSYSERDLRRLAAEKARIMKLARADPENALYWRTFFAVATPDEVRAIIGGRSLGIKTVKGKQRAYVHGLDALEALPFALFDKAFWTGYRTVRQQYSSLVEAAPVTPHPEVIHILVQAGCKATDLNSRALLLATYNPNPAVLDAVLQHKPNLKAETHALGSPLSMLAATEPAVFRKELFRLLLQAGADPNGTSGPDKKTPLMQAAFYRNIEAARMLLEAGANAALTDRTSDSALGIAVSREAYDLARLLLKTGGLTDRGRAALHSLARNETTDAALVRDLVAASGAESQEVSDAVSTAARHGNMATLRALLNAGARGPDAKTTMNSALFAAVSEHPNNVRSPKDKPEIVALLLEHGADPGVRFSASDFGSEALRKHWIFRYGNVWGDVEASALHMAADYGLSRTVALLLKAGAAADMVDKRGQTPLYWASSYGSLGEDAYNRGRPERLAACAAAAALLLRAGADPLREEQNGWSPLLTSLSNPGIVTLFLKSPGVKARVNAVTGSGWTPLTYAASHERLAETIPLLLSAGADPKKPDSAGALALEIALEKKNGKAAAYLGAAGVNPRGRASGSLPRAQAASRRK